MAIGMAVSYYFRLGFDENFWETMGNFLGGFLSPFYYMGYVFNKVNQWRGPEVPIGYIILSNMSFVIFMLLAYRIVYIRFRTLWFHGFRTTSIIKEFSSKVRAKT
jgi:hypothetical protein